jgi:hypothetical protein
VIGANGNVSPFNVQNGYLGNSIYLGLMTQNGFSFPIQVGLDQTANKINLGGYTSIRFGT